MGREGSTPTGPKQAIPRLTKPSRSISHSLIRGSVSSGVVVSNRHRSTMLEGSPSARATRKEVPPHSTPANLAILQDVKVSFLRSNRKEEYSRIG